MDPVGRGSLEFYLSLKQSIFLLSFFLFLFDISFFSIFFILRSKFRVFHFIFLADLFSVD